MVLLLGKRFYKKVARSLLFCYNKTMGKILEKLNKLQDKKYAEFQVKLIPTVDKKAIIGVRTPKLRELAKELVKADREEKKEVDKFLQSLPHKFFDENQLHAFILSETKDFEDCIKKVDKFLPYIDNWATCDQLSPKSFAKNKEALFKYINKWIKSKKAYIIRFAIGMLMQNYLDKDFDKKYLDIVANIEFNSAKKKKANDKIKENKKETISIEIDPNKYYVEMMRAWYFATALAKQYKDTLPYIKNKKLEPWTHNKTIQKAIESFRVSENHKNELRKLKI